MTAQLRASKAEPCDARPNLSNGSSVERNDHSNGYQNSAEMLPTQCTFPDEGLKKTLEDSSKTPLVLVACGSFSPITYLHLRMFEMAADFVRSQTRFEMVGGYLSPVADAYKKSGLASSAHRIAMAELAVQGAPRIMVDPWEANQKEYTRTAVVLDRFDYEINTVRGGVATSSGERRPVRIALLAGADLIGTMSTPGVWSSEDLDHILGRFGAFIIERQGTDIDEALATLQKWRENIYVIPQLIQNDVSSTKVRSFLSKDMSVRYLIPPPVICYIEQHGLYEDESRASNPRKVKSAETASTPDIVPSPSIDQQIEEHVIG